MRILTSPANFRRALGAQRRRAFAHFLFLAEPHLGGDVGPGQGERARFAAAALVQRTSLPISWLTTLSGW